MHQALILMWPWNLLCYWASIGTPQSWQSKHTADILSWPERDVPLLAELRHPRTISLAEQQHWTETPLNPSSLLPLSCTTFSSFLHSSRVLMGRKEQNPISSFIMANILVATALWEQKELHLSSIRQNNWNPVFHSSPIHLIIQWINYHVLSFSYLLGFLFLRLSFGSYP